MSETWNAFIHLLEISVRKKTADKGSASRGMIAMCGEKQIAVNSQHFLCGGGGGYLEVVEQTLRSQ